MGKSGRSGPLGPPASCRPAGKALARGFFDIRCTSVSNQGRPCAGGVCLSSWGRAMKGRGPSFLLVRPVEADPTCVVGTP